MALRQIRLLGDEMLTKPCREIKEITPRITELIDDMLETMYEADGIGLAAPQVGVLRRVVVIDVWQEGMEELTENGEPVESEDEAGSVDEVRSEDKAATGDEAESEATADPEETEGSGEVPEAEESEEWEEEEIGPLIMINPVITRKEGEQTGDEGCLSLPGKVGQVTRPEFVTVTYFDENMDEYELEAEGLLARAICHEVDHLDGHMYVELVEGEIHDINREEPEEEELSGDDAKTGT